MEQAKKELKRVELGRDLWDLKWAELVMVKNWRIGCSCLPDGQTDKRRVPGEIFLVAVLLQGNAGGS